MASSASCLHRLSLRLRTFLPIRANQKLLWAFLGAAAILCAWNGALLARRRTFKLEVVLKRQHYLQACAQAAVFVYWGWYWGWKNRRYWLTGYTQMEG